MPTLTGYWQIFLVFFLLIGIRARNWGFIHGRIWQTLFYCRHANKTGYIRHLHAIKLVGDEWLTMFELCGDEQELTFGMPKQYGVVQ